MSFDKLSPINYVNSLIGFCQGHTVFTVITSIGVFLFGTEISALLIALAALALDTITGVTVALVYDFKHSHEVKKNKKEEKGFTSAVFWQVIPKTIAVLSAFVMGQLIQTFYGVTIGTLIESSIAGLIIAAEASSVLENIGKIHQPFSMRKIIQKIKKLKK